MNVEKSKMKNKNRVFVRMYKTLYFLNLTVLLIINNLLKIS